MSARQDIVSALVTKLKEIDGTGSYKSNIFGNCLDKQTWWTDCNDFPTLCVVAGREEREYLPGFKWGLLNVSIKVYVKREDPLQELEDLISDVELVIDNNYRLQYGSEACQKTTDIMIDDIITDEGLLVPYGIAEVNIKVKYQVLNLQN